jgi:hypothetical protein
MVYGVKKIFLAILLYLKMHGKAKKIKFYTRDIFRKSRNAGQDISRKLQFLSQDTMLDLCFFQKSRVLSPKTILYQDYFWKIT